MLWGQSVLISGSSLRGNIGAAILLRQTSSSAGAGCYGTIVAEASSVSLPPIAQLLGVLERVRMDGVLLLKNPVLAGPSIVIWPDFSPRRLSMGDSHQEGSPLTGSGHDLSPPLGVGDLPSPLGIKAHSTKVWRPPRPFGRCTCAGHLWCWWGVYAPNFPGSTTWLCEPPLACLFPCHSCAFHTLSRDLQVWRRGHLVPHSVSTQLDVPGGERPRLRM